MEILSMDLFHTYSYIVLDSQNLFWCLPICNVSIFLIFLELFNFRTSIYHKCVFFNQRQSFSVQPLMYLSILSLNLNKDIIIWFIFFTLCHVLLLLLWMYSRKCELNVTASQVDFWVWLWYTYILLSISTYESSSHRKWYFWTGKCFPFCTLLWSLA